MTKSGLPAVGGALPSEAAEFAASGVFRFAPPRVPAKPGTTLREEVERFIRACKTAGDSSHTLAAYRGDLADFEATLKRRSRRTVTPRDASSPHAIEYFLLDLRRRGLSPATRERRFYALKAFFAWRAVFMDVPDPAALVDPPRATRTRLAVKLTEDEARRLCDSCDMNSRRPRDVFASAVIETLYSTAMRESELIALRWRDVDMEGGSVLIRRGKGGKSRPAFLVAKAVAALRAWRKVVLLRHGREALANSEPIFIRSGGRATFIYRSEKPRPLRPVTARCIQKLVATRGVSALGRRLWPHLLRHAALTQMLERGAALPALSKIAGHASLSTTQRYTHVNETYLRGQAARLSGEGNL